MIREMNREAIREKLPLRFVLEDAPEDGLEDALEDLKTRLKATPIARIKRSGAQKKDRGRQSRTEGAILVKDLFA